MSSSIPKDPVEEEGEQKPGKPNNPDGNTASRNSNIAGCNTAADESVGGNATGGNTVAEETVGGNATGGNAGKQLVEDREVIELLGRIYLCCLSMCGLFLGILVPSLRTWSVAH